MRLLVDTNVFLDFLLERDKDTTNASESFFRWAKEKNNEIYVTSMSLRDIEYVAHRKFHDKKASKMIQIAVYRMCYKVLGISPDAAINSLYSDIDDYEDSLIIEAAKELLLDGVVTNNKKDFLHAGIPIFTPSEIVNLGQ